MLLAHTAGCFRVDMNMMDRCSLSLFFGRDAIFRDFGPNTFWGGNHDPRGRGWWKYHGTGMKHNHGPFAAAGVVGFNPSCLEGRGRASVLEGKIELLRIFKDEKLGVQLHPKAGVKQGHRGDDSLGIGHRPFA